MGLERLPVDSQSGPWMMARVTSVAPPAISEIRAWPRHMSYSQLSNLHPSYRYSCARRAAYRYIAHLPEERNWSLALGTAVDAGANLYWSFRISGVDVKEAEDDGWKAADAEITHEVQTYPELTADRDPEIVDKYRSLAHFCLAELWERMRPLTGAAVQKHQTFDLSLGDVTVGVAGYSDLVTADGDVWDLKVSGSPRWTMVPDPDWVDTLAWHEGMRERNPETGRMRKVPQPKAPELEQWDAEYLAEKKDQLLSYFLARNDEAERKGLRIDPPLSGRLHLVVIYANLNLKHPQLHETVIDVDWADAQPLLIRYGQAVRMVQARRFPLRPGRHCAWCSFLDRCREDQAARGLSFADSIDVPF